MGHARGPAGHPADGRLHGAAPAVDPAGCDLLLNTARILVLVIERQIATERRLDAAMAEIRSTRAMAESAESKASAALATLSDGTGYMALVGWNALLPARADPPGVVGLGQAAHPPLPRGGDPDQAGPERDLGQGQRLSRRDPGGSSRGGSRRPPGKSPGRTAGTRGPGDAHDQDITI